VCVFVYNKDKIPENNIEASICLKEHEWLCDTQHTQHTHTQVQSVRDLVKKMCTHADGGLVRPTFSEAEVYGGLGRQRFSQV